MTGHFFPRPPWSIPLRHADISPIEVFDGICVGNVEPVDPMRGGRCAIPLRHASASPREMVPAPPETEARVSMSMVFMMLES
jgi:hypothetical protein